MNSQRVVNWSVRDVKRWLKSVLFVPRSMAEKRNMFESASPSKESGPSQDPALLPLSQRRALFDKNRGVVVKPVARFGESVTPAMLAKTPSDPPVRKAEVPASEPAWKRKREV